MSEEIINPFKQIKKTNWVEKTNKRAFNIQTEKNKTNADGKIFKENKLEKIEKNKKINNNNIRIAKSFKIFKGRLSRDFDKRVKKLQVKFDDLDYDKNYVDSGKYIMFLIAFAEKYKLYELFKPVDGNGNIDIDKDKILKYFEKIIK